MESIEKFVGINILFVALVFAGFVSNCTTKSHRSMVSLNIVLAYNKPSHEFSGNENMLINIWHVHVFV